LFEFSIYIILMQVLCILYCVYFNQLMHRYITQQYLFIQCTFVPC